MRPVFALSSNITTSLGVCTADVWDAVMNGQTGIQQHAEPSLSPTPFWASFIDERGWQKIEESTKTNPGLSAFERMAFYSAKEALTQCALMPDPAKTVLILATTKGNIEGLSDNQEERDLLTTSARIIGEALGLPNTPVVISHACVSGVSALLYGMRLLQGGMYEHAIVVGADRFSRFVLSGFQSFQAIADEPCKPFDAERKGINLGEAAATILLSVHDIDTKKAMLCGGSTSNDANHISGPSRTGEELSMAIARALNEAALQPGDIQAISAHGTATIYNDEMEAKAFAHAGLLHAEVYSIKGYLGHTLGAAGILESALVIESLKNQQNIPSLGFKELGVSEPIFVATETKQTALNYILKTASGFGGCNAVAIWGRAN